MILHHIHHTIRQLEGARISNVYKIGWVPHLEECTAAEVEGAGLRAVLAAVQHRHQPRPELLQSLHRLPRRVLGGRQLRRLSRVNLCIARDLSSATQQSLTTMMRLSKTSSRVGRTLDSSALK